MGTGLGRFRVLRDGQCLKVPTGTAIPGVSALAEGRASAGGALASGREASYALEVAAGTELIGRVRVLQVLSDRLDRAAAGEVALFSWQVSRVSGGR